MNKIKPTTSDDTPKSSERKCHLSSLISYSNLHVAHTRYILNMTSITEPTTYEEAICDENQGNVIQSELTALMKTNTWKLVHLPTHKKDIGCRWVFKLKLYDDGYMEIYKARLVAKGFTQTEGLNYVDTFSPVVKMATIRVFMAIATAQK